MLIVPASFQGFRGVFLSLLVLFSFRMDLAKRLFYDKVTVYLAIINIAASVFFILNGLILSAPGALNVSTVYVIWPIIYFYFIGYNSKKSDILPYMSIVLYGGLVSSVLIILFIINSLIGLPFISSVAAGQDFSVGFYEGFIELNSMNLATVLYVFSFSLTIILLPKEFNYFSKGKLKFLNLLCFILSIVMILISARRAFWVICFICPFIIIAMFKLSNIQISIGKYLRPFLGVAFLTIAAFFILSFDISSFTTEFDTIFEFDNPAEESNYLRKEQYNALVNGWKESPVFGNGLGASASASIRDDSAPWAYELSYIALLFQTGLVGIFIYGGSIIWIIYKSIKIMREQSSLAVFMLAPQIVGLICFLIINASNPYLAKFDYLWTIFLPLATINVFSLDLEDSENMEMSRIITE